MAVGNISCPKCGAVLEIPEHPEPTIICARCQNVASVPKELLANANENLSAAVHPQEQPPRKLKPINQLDLDSLDAEVHRLLAEDSQENALQFLQRSLKMGQSEASMVIDKVQAGESLLEGLIAADPDTARFLLARKAHRTTAQYSSPLDSDKVSPLQQIKNLRSCVVQFIWFIFLLFIFVPATSYVLVQQKTFIHLVEKYNPFAFARVSTSIDGNTPGLPRMEDPRAIAIDASGFVYIADFDDARVFRFNRNGVFQNRWTIKQVTDQLPQINGMAVSPEGLVYVSVDGKIIVYDGATGQEMRQMTIFEPGTSHQIRLADIYLDSQNNLAVVYNGENFAVLDKTGSILTAVESAISLRTQQPELESKIAGDAGSNVYILGTYNSTVVKYGTDGRFLIQFAAPGTNPGQLGSALSLAIDPKGQVFISDFIGISIFTQEGRFLQRFELPSGVVYAMSFDRDGDLWVITSENRILELQLPD